MATVKRLNHLRLRGSPASLGLRLAIFAGVLAFCAVITRQTRSAAQPPAGKGKPAKEAVVGVRTQEPATSSAPAAAPNTVPDRRRAHTIPTSPLEIAEALGLPLLSAFLVASVIAVWFTVERLLLLRRGRVIPRPFVDRFLQNLEQGNLDPEEALRLCEQNGSPVATVFAHAIRKWGKPSVEVEQAIIDGGERQAAQLRSHLRALNAIATLGPLLGLLGTVMGMIRCFNEIATSQAMGKADQLAGGIAVALLATAVGLLIAIISLTMYMYLAGRADSLVVDMDLLAQDVVYLISAEAIAGGAQAPDKGRPRRAPAEAKERRAV